MVPAGQNVERRGETKRIAVCLSVSAWTQQQWRACFMTTIDPSALYATVWHRLQRVRTVVVYR